MRKTVFWVILAVTGALSSCKKDVVIDHHVSAEFPAQEILEPVSVLFSDSGDADIRIASDGSVNSSLDGIVTEMLSGGEYMLRYRSLALVWGSSPDVEDLMEESFWTEPSLQWIVYTDSWAGPLRDCGFVDCFTARGLEATEDLFRLYAGSAVYDKISGLGANPTVFTVKVKEDVQ